MEVHFQCTIQICRYQCPDQCDSGKNQQPSYGGGSSSSANQVRIVFLVFLNEKGRKITIYL